ncbi:MAG: SGNH/GDSL hydrolase family protein [Gemmatimonadaceae bacterium]|nr:SGNH/GDSL hydrolase family protein [Gemmatimonadaceae bacterium]
MLANTRRLFSSARRASCVAMLSIVSLMGCLPKADVLAPLPDGGIRVLFVGNSLTYFNNLPGTLIDLALTTGDTINSVVVAFPDYALVDHLRQGSAVQVIAGTSWNFVVLQQGPSSVQVNRDSLIEMTRLFDGPIRRAGARTSLFSVWPQTGNAATFPRAIESYQLAATAVGGVYLPVGAAWQVALAEDATIPLYDGDGLHPSPLGTYLAALVMYERFTFKDCRLLPAQAVVDNRVLTDVPERVVRRLQEIAHGTSVLTP